MNEECEHDLPPSGLRPPTSDLRPLPSGLCLLFRHPVLVVFVVAVILNLAGGVFSGIDRPLTSDPGYFLEAAKNVAAGEGYSLSAEHTFWPDQPSMRRLPGWPLLMALFLKLLPVIAISEVKTVMPAAHASHHGHDHADEQKEDA